MARRSRAFLLLAAIYAALSLVAPALAGAATYVVNTIDDLNDGTCTSLHCSLREAIEAANANPGHDLIAFEVVGPPPHSIAPVTPYSAITDSVTIDGTTDSHYAGTPVVEVHGTLAGPGASGLTILAGNSTVRGLAINRFVTGAGILLDIRHDNVVESNYIGTDVTGNLDLGNQYGVFVINSLRNRIGGTTPAQRNVISGNDNYGIWIRENAQHTDIFGNYIGTNATGNAPVGNLRGIEILSDNTDVGAFAGGGGNVISANQVGISIFSNNNNVWSNLIGTDATGTLDLGNTSLGIESRGASNGFGGAAARLRNVISGNNEGIRLVFASSTGNQILGNFIGTDITGTQDIGNTLAGVELFFGATNNSVGGGGDAARNVISGNDSIGVWIDTSTSNTVLGNYIGTDVTGEQPLGNRDYGVMANSASSNVIGQVNVGNLISANGDGVRVQGSSTANLIQSNLIGTDDDGVQPLGNRSDGILLIASGNTIGGLASGSNTIAFNGARGVNVGSGDRNGIFRNSIHTNAQLGIDLGSNGVTPNDPGDLDPGPNQFQNYPVLTSASRQGSTTTVEGTLNSQPSTTYRVELFANRVCDPSGFGEGERFIGAVDVTTDAIGTATFSFSSGDGQVGEAITSTATDPLSNTSEFSNCAIVEQAVGPPATVVVTPPAATNTVGDEHCVTATVRDASGNPTPGVTVFFTVTGSNPTSGQATTNAGGQAQFCYTGTRPGEDAITATADANGNGTADPGEPTGAATKTWLPGQPVTLTLDPKVGTNAVGTEHCVTATVRDALLNPVPGVLVRFSVTGANTAAGTSTTDANGQARFCYTGTNAGEDVITAYADSNGNASPDPGEPSDRATKTWTAVVECPPGDDDHDDDGLDDEREHLFGSFAHDSDSDDDGVKDGDEDSDHDDEDDEDEDDDTDPCPDDSDDDGEDDEDEDDGEEDDAD